MERRIDGRDPPPGRSERLYLNVHVRQDGFGRIVLDECPSDLEHLQSCPTDPATNRPQCRQLVEGMFAAFVGKKGTLYVDVYFEEDKP